MFLFVDHRCVREMAVEGARCGPALAVGRWWLMWGEGCLAAWAGNHGPGGRMHVGCKPAKFQEITRKHMQCKLSMFNLL